MTVTLLAVVILVSFAVIRIGAVLLELTGMEWEQCFIPTAPSGSA